MLLVWWLFLGLVILYGLYIIGVKENQRNWWMIFEEQQSVGQIIGTGFAKVTADISSINMKTIMKKVKVIQRLMDRDINNENRNQRELNPCG